MNSFLDRRRAMPPVCVAGAIGLVLSGLAAVPAQAQVIVAPNAFGATNGGGQANTAPFNNISRYQQIYAASQFSALSGPELITQIAFRPSVQQNAFTYTDLSIQFDLSTTKETVASLSPTFAANVGSNDQVVYSGALTFTSAGTPGGGAAGPFDAVVTLTTPFLYDPTQGNLVLDIRNFATPTNSIFIDGGGDPSTALVFVDNSTSAATGTVQPAGLSTQFKFAPVPEASTTVSLGLLLGIGGLVIAARRKKAHAKA